MGFHHPYSSQGFSSPTHPRLPSLEFSLSEKIINRSIKSVSLWDGAPPPAAGCGSGRAPSRDWAVRSAWPACCPPRALPLPRRDSCVVLRWRTELLRHQVTDCGVNISFCLRGVGRIPKYNFNSVFYISSFFSYPFKVQVLFHLFGRQRDGGRKTKSAPVHWCLPQRPSQSQGSSPGLSGKGRSPKSLNHSSCLQATCWEAGLEAEPGLELKHSDRWCGCPKQHGNW